MSVCTGRRALPGASWSIAWARRAALRARGSRRRQTPPERAGAGRAGRCLPSSPRGKPPGWVRCGGRLQRVSAGLCPRLGLHKEARKRRRLRRVALLLLCVATEAPTQGGEGGAGVAFCSRHPPSRRTMAAGCCPRRCWRLLHGCGHLGTHPCC